MEGFSGISYGGRKKTRAPPPQTASGCSQSLCGVRQHRTLVAVLYLNQSQRLSAFVGCAAADSKELRKPCRLTFLVPHIETWLPFITKLSSGSVVRGFCPETR